MRKKKDIVFLLQFFYPEYISSAQLPYETILKLREAGFTVDALCGYPHEYAKDSNLPTKEEVNGIHIHRLKYIQMDRSGFLGRLVNYFSFTLMVLLNLGEIARYKTVVVYSNPPILPWIASWAKVLFGTKLVFVSYDLYPEVATKTNTLREGNIICRLMNHINKCVYTRSDAIVALSREMKEYIVNHRPIAKEKVHVIPNWYTDKGAKPLNLQDNRFADVVKGRFVVSYFGNMGTMQDMDTILGAIRRLRDNPDIFFLFAGHGNKMEKLKKIVKDEFISNIAIYDFLHGKDFQDALQISSCALISLEAGATGLCVPSKTYSYMMQGIPLLAIMDESDIVSDIESGTGYWVRNGESEKLAEKILAMHGDPEGLHAMSRKCRQLYLEKYTMEICTEKYVDLFRKILPGEYKETKS